MLNRIMDTLLTQTLISDVSTVTSSLSSSAEAPVDYVFVTSHSLSAKKKYLHWEAALSEPRDLVLLQPPDRPSSFHLGLGRPASSFLY